MNQSITTTTTTTNNKRRTSCSDPSSPSPPNVSKKRARVKFSDQQHPTGSSKRPHSLKSSRLDPDSEIQALMMNQDDDDDSDSFNDSDSSTNDPTTNKINTRHKHIGHDLELDDSDSDPSEFTCSQLSKNKIKKFVPLSNLDQESQDFGPTTRKFIDSDDDNGGIQIEPFNMRAEMSQGGFDGDGTYHLVVDPNQQFDNWLTGVTEQDMEAAQLAHQKHQEQLLHSDTAHSTTLFTKLRISTTKECDPNELVKSLCSLLATDTETPTRALSRLNIRVKRQVSSSIKKKKTTKNNNNTKNQHPVSMNPHAPAAQISSEWAIEDIELITDLCNYLLSTSTTEFGDIYSMSRQELVQDLRDQNIVERSWVPLPHPLSDKRCILWSYQWHADKTVYGPFKPQEMYEWACAGFFDAGISVQLCVNNVPVSDKVWIDGDCVVKYNWGLGY